MLLKRRKALSLYKAVVIDKMINVNSVGSQDWEVAIQELIKYRDISRAWKKRSFRGTVYCYPRGSVVINGYNIFHFVEICQKNLTPFHFPIFGTSFTLPIMPDFYLPWKRLTKNFPKMLDKYGHQILKLSLRLTDLHYEDYETLSTWLSLMPNLYDLKIKFVTDPLPLPNNLEGIKFPQLMYLDDVRTQSRYMQTAFFQAILKANPQRF